MNLDMSRIRNLIHTWMKNIFKGHPHVDSACKRQEDCVPVVVEECDGRILRAWKNLCSEPRLFIKALMDSIDILTEHFGSLNLYDVRRRCNISFDKGWKEPEF